MSNRGFTLMEIVVALAITGVCLFSILTGISQAKIASQEALDRGQALVIAENQLQLYLAGETSPLQGQVQAGEGPRFNWELRESRAGEGLRKVEVIVRWQGISAPRHLSVSGLKEVE